MTDNPVFIYALLMVKNEAKNIEKTLMTTLGICNQWIIYDTGSTDNTIEIIQNLADKYSMPLSLKQGQFIDFATSRNELIDFANTVYSNMGMGTACWYLFLDCDDEIKNGPELISFLTEYDDKDKYEMDYLHEKQPTDEVFLAEISFLYENSNTSFYNYRIAKAPLLNWRYVGKVHENLHCDNDDYYVRKVPNFYIQHDRSMGLDIKTSIRFHNDLKVLLEEKEKTPGILRFIAQTYECLKDYENAYDYYEQCAKLSQNDEEIYYCYYKIAGMCELLEKSWDEVLSNYMKAINVQARVEPMIEIARFYGRANYWLIAHGFLSMAVKLNPYPNSTLCVNKYYYDYARYHMFAVACDKIGDNLYGKIYAEKALEFSMNPPYTCEIYPDEDEKMLREFNDELDKMR